MDVSVPQLYELVGRKRIHDRGQPPNWMLQIVFATPRPGTLCDRSWHSADGTRVTFGVARRDGTVFELNLDRAGVPTGVDAVEGWPTVRFSDLKQAIREEEPDAGTFTLRVELSAPAAPVGEICMNTASGEQCCVGVGDGGRIECFELRSSW